MIPSILLTLALTAAPVAAGDAVHGAALYRLHCAACHGLRGTGDGPLAKALGSPRPTDLRAPAFLVEHSDDDLLVAMLKGGRPAGRSFTMPGFEGTLDPLDTFDLVAFMRQGEVRIEEVFPDAARFSARSEALDADALARLEPLLGTLSGEERIVPLAMVYGGEHKDGEGASYVPQDPRRLGLLKPKQKIGYLAFPTLRLPGVTSEVTLALAMEKDGAIRRIVIPGTGLSEQDRTRADRLLKGFEGQGGKHAPGRPTYQALKAPKQCGKEGADVARALTRAYYLSLEGAVMADKDERDRHWAD